jgi:hypothetical protein
MNEEEDGPNQGLDHPNIGAALFEYCHVEGGARSRYAFNMRVGDNPDFWKARLLMPGAEFIGICHAAWDTGACEAEDSWPVFTCHVWAGNSVFEVELPAKNLADARRRCAEIGGLRPAGDAHPTMMDRVRLRLRWLWERRPVVRFRSPLDVFS